MPCRMQLTTNLVISEKENKQMWFAEAAVSAGYGKQKWERAGSKILFPRLGVLNIVQQGPAVRAHS